MTRFVVVGDLMTDVVAVASGPMAAGSDTRSVVTLSGGGSAANTAAWLGHLGQPVSYVGRVGDDLLGRSAVEALAACGVDVRVTIDADLPSGVCVIVVTPGGERSMFPSAGANAGLSAADLPGELFVAPNHLHLSGYTLLTAGSRDAGLEALRLAGSAGLTVSVDPASVGPLRDVGVDAFLSWTRGADLLLANADEAQLLAGCVGVVEAGRTLLDSYPQVVIKAGALGAHWFGRGVGSAHVPALAGSVVDSTGAGDCFAAGFLPAWVAGAAAEDALRAGCAAAAHVLGRSGARPQ